MDRSYLDRTQNRSSPVQFTGPTGPHGLDLQTLGSDIDNGGNMVVREKVVFRFATEHFALTSQKLTPTSLIPLLGKGYSHVLFDLFQCIGHISTNTVAQLCVTLLPALIAPIFAAVASTTRRAINSAAPNGITNMVSSKNAGYVLRGVSYIAASSTATAVSNAQAS